MQKLLLLVCLIALLPACAKKQLDEKFTQALIERLTGHKEEPRFEVHVEPEEEKEPEQQRTLHKDMSLHFSVYKNDIDSVKRLVKKGADVNASLRGQDFEYTNILDNFLFDVGVYKVNQVASQKLVGIVGMPTPLHIASEEGFKDIVEYLIDRGANVNIKEPSEGRTPLHLASQRGYVDIVGLLVQAGADVNAKYDREQGRTPLHLASLGNQEEVVRLLMENGADPNIADKEGCSPLDIAYENDDVGIIEYLEENKAQRNQSKISKLFSSCKTRFFRLNIYRHSNPE